MVHRPLTAGRGLLWLALVGVPESELHDAALPQWNAIREESYLFEDVAEVASPLGAARVGAFLHGVGSWKSDLDEAESARRHPRHGGGLLPLLADWDDSLTTASLFDDPHLHETVVSGAPMDLRTQIPLGALRAVERRSEFLQECMGRPEPPLLQVVWSLPEGLGGAQRAAWFEQVDKEVGFLWEQVARRQRDLGEHIRIVFAEVALPGARPPARRARRTSEAARHRVGVWDRDWPRATDRSAIDLVDAAATGADFLFPDLPAHWSLDGVPLRPGAALVLGSNLVVNGDFERQRGWTYAWTETKVAGWRGREDWAVRPWGAFGAGLADEQAKQGLGGRNVLTAGGTSDSELQQTIDLAVHLEHIRARRLEAHLAARLGGSGASNSLECRVEWLDGDGRTIQTLELEAVRAADRRRGFGVERGVALSGLLIRSARGPVPPKTRAVRVLLQHRSGQSLNEQSWIDDVQLVLSAKGG